MFGDNNEDILSQSRGNSDLELIQQLNALTLPELKTFATNATDNRTRSIANTLYDQKIKQSTNNLNYQQMCDSADKYLRF